MLCCSPCKAWCHGAQPGEFATHAGRSDVIRQVTCYTPFCAKRQSFNSQRGKPLLVAFRPKISCRHSCRMTRRDSDCIGYQQFSITRIGAPSPCAKNFKRSIFSDGRATLRPELIYIQDNGSRKEVRTYFPATWLNFVCHLSEQLQQTNPMTSLPQNTLFP